LKIVKSIIQLCFFFSLIWSQPEYLIKKFSIKEGLSQSQVMAITQDKMSYLWVGTRNGLNRFDGSEFIHYSKFSHSVFSSNSIRDVQIDENNRIWVGTDNGFFGIDVRSDGTISFGVGPFLPNQIIYDILIEQNEIFVATSFGVYKFIDLLNPKQHRHLQIEKDEDCLMINPMDTLGNKIVSYSSTNYYQINPRFEINKLPYNVGISFNSYYNSSSKEILLPTLNSLAIINNENEMEKLLDVECYDIAKNGQSYILGTLYDGVYILDNKFKILSKISPEKISPAIRRIFIDEDSNYWIGTDAGGLYLVTKNNFKSYSTDDGLPDNIVWSIKADTLNRTTFVGTYDGIAEISDGKVKYPDFNKKLSNPSINAIEIDRNGGLYLGTDLSLNYVSPDRNSVKYFEKKVMSLSRGAMIHTLKFDRLGNLWVGTDYHPNIVKYSTDGEWTPFDFGAKLDQDIVKDIEFDSSGTMWIISDNYIAKKQSHFWEPYYLNGIKIYDLEILQNGNIVVGTEEGVWQLSDRTFIRYKAKVDSSFSVYFVKEDLHNNVWYGTNNGVICDKTTVEFNHYTQKHGLIGNETNARAVTMDHNGSIWIGTVNGVSQFLGKEEEHETIPKVYIHSLSTKSQVHYDFSQNLRFAQSPDIFNFNYGSVLLNRSDPIEYGIRLIGLDDECKWTDSDEAVYGSLKSGQYTFQVKGKISTDEQSDVAEISFSISPNFFESPLFYFALIILTIVLTWYISLTIRKRQIEKEKRCVEFYFFRDKFYLKVFGNILSNTVIQSNKIRSLFEVIVLKSLIDKTGIEQSVIMKQFWPSGTLAQNKNRRNVAISKIRFVFDKELHGKVITIEDGYYKLDLDSNFVYCDVLDFIKNYKLGERYLRQQNITKTVFYFQKVVDLHGSSGLLNEIDNPTIIAYRREYIKYAHRAAEFILSHKKEVSKKQTIDLCNKITRLNSNQTFPSIRK